MKLALIAFAAALPLAATLTACQSPPCPITTIETDDLDLAASVADRYQPILISRADLLTADTAKAIRDHNDVYWCEHKDRRPPGFDDAVCETPNGGPLDLLAGG